MCFSAPISFTASAVLLPTGLYSLHLAYQRNPSYLPLACIPIAFAIQQACEGMVWLGFGADSPVETNLGAFGFLFFAYWFWLFWSPWSVAQLELKPTVQRVCWGIGFLGLVYGGLLYLPLLGQPTWLTVHIIHQSIQYETRLIFDPWLSQQVDRTFYAIIILTPFAIASNRFLRFLGAAVCLSAIASHWLLNEVFTSVWCFFAALLSLFILYICRTAPPMKLLQKNADFLLPESFEAATHEVSIKQQMDM